MNLDRLSTLSAVEAAQVLLGAELSMEINNEVIRVCIVETEAYDQTDAASHSYKGATLRTDVMFGRAGHLYVYFTYGMHYCCNVVVGKIGHGAAVLIRAVEPLEGEAAMERLRGKTGTELCNGPAKLCQALKIDKSFNGHDLRHSPLKLSINAPVDASLIVTTPRVGISKAKDVQWRFYLRNNDFISRP